MARSYFAFCVEPRGDIVETTSSDRRMTHSVAFVTAATGDLVETIHLYRCKLVQMKESGTELTKLRGNGSVQIIVMEEEGSQLSQGCK